MFRENNHLQEIRHQMLALFPDFRLSASDWHLHKEKGNYWNLMLRDYRLGETHVSVLFTDCPELSSLHISFIFRDSEDATPVEKASVCALGCSSTAFCSYWNDDFIVPYEDVVPFLTNYIPTNWEKTESQMVIDHMVANALCEEERKSEVLFSHPVSDKLRDKILREIGERGFFTSAIINTPFYRHDGMAVTLLMNYDEYSLTNTLRFICFSNDGTQTVRTKRAYFRQPYADLLLEAIHHDLWHLRVHRYGGLFSKFPHEVPLASDPDFKHLYHPDDECAQFVGSGYNAMKNYKDVMNNEC